MSCRDSLDDSRDSPCRARSLFTVQAAIVALGLRAPGSGIDDRDPNGVIGDLGFDVEEILGAMPRMLDGVGAGLPRRENDVLRLVPRDRSLLEPDAKRVSDQVERV